MSVDQFWNMDWWTFQYLYDKEMEIIKLEAKDNENNTLASKSTSSSGKMVANKIPDSQEGIDAYNSFMVDDDDD